MTKKIVKPVSRSRSTHRDIREGFGKEMNSWEEEHIRGPKLTFIYNSLLSIHCTSTESERNFSAAGRIVNKLSTRLGDKSVCDLSMLKGYFKSKLLVITNVQIQ